jgi:hypothetical protein
MYVPYTDGMYDLPSSGVSCSLRLIILFANVDISRHILMVDTFILTKSNMDWNKYHNRII